MKMIRQFISTLAVLVVLGAIGSSSASAAPEFLLLPGGKFPVAFTSKSGATTWQTAAGAAIKCTADTDSGEIENARLGKVTIDLTGCKQGALGCRSEAGGVKDPVETILVKNADVHLTAERAAGNVLEGVVWVILLEVLKVDCGALLHEFRGALPGLITPINQFTTGAELKSAESKGKQETGECVELKEDCEKLAKEPFEENETGEFEAAGAESADNITFAEMVEIMA
ncbi:MAG: hypothetical protein ACHQHO_13035 [Solirubrobacterales bacterium]